MFEATKLNFYLKKKILKKESMYLSLNFVGCNLNLFLLTICYKNKKIKIKKLIFYFFKYRHLARISLPLTYFKIYPTSSPDFFYAVLFC